MKHNNRIVGLDVLRGIAVLLVLFRHSLFENNLLHKFGWLGVDLFFVLSGFLISSVLFKEFIKKGAIKPIRFLLRRAFKIFPPFYFFLLFSLITYYLIDGKLYSLDKIMAEVFYLQSYSPHIFQHTWSLAVEEQFYILFVVFLAVGVRFKVLRYKVLFISIFILLICLCFFLRFRIAEMYPHDKLVAFGQSHLRADGIVIGVFVSYLYNFFRQVNLKKKVKYVLYFLSFVFILPGFIFEGAFYFMNTLGLSLVNIGFGLFLYLLMYEKPSAFIHNKRHLFIRVIAFIGIHSYSIYLWHLYAKEFISSKLHISILRQVIIYYIMAFLLGIIFSTIIEKPFLRLRERVLK